MKLTLVQLRLKKSEYRMPAVKTHDIKHVTSVTSVFLLQFTFPPHMECFP